MVRTILEALAGIGWLNLAMSASYVTSAPQRVASSNTSVHRLVDSTWVEDSGVPHRQRYHGSQHHVLMRRGSDEIAYSQGTQGSLLEEFSRGKADMHDGMKTLSAAALHAHQDLDGGAEHDPYFLWRLQEQIARDKQNSKGSSLGESVAHAHSMSTAEVERERRVAEIVRVEVATLEQNKKNCSELHGKSADCENEANCEYEQVSEKCIYYACDGVKFEGSEACSTNSVCQWNDDKDHCAAKTCSDLNTKDWCSSSRVCRWSISTEKCMPRPCNVYDKADTCGTLASCTWDDVSSECEAQTCEGFNETLCKANEDKSCTWSEIECNSPHRFTTAEECNGTHIKWINDKQCAADCAKYETKQSCEGVGDSGFHVGCSWAEVDISDDGIKANTCTRTCSNKVSAKCDEYTAEDCSLVASLKTDCPAMCNTCSDACNIYGKETCSSKSCSWMSDTCKKKCSELKEKTDCEEAENDHCTWSPNATRKSNCTDADAGSLSSLAQFTPPNLTITLREISSLSENKNSETLLNSTTASRSSPSKMPTLAQRKSSDKLPNVTIAPHGSPSKKAMSTQRKESERSPQITVTSYSSQSKIPGPASSLPQRDKSGNSSNILPRELNASTLSLY